MSAATKKARAMDRKPTAAQVAAARKKLGANCPPDLRPVGQSDLEALAQRVAQATSTLSILTEEAGGDLQNALGLVSDSLDQCADDLFELDRRFKQRAEVQS
jgi:hypothetical protein